MTYLELTKLLQYETPSQYLSNEYIKEKLFELIPELEMCDGFKQHSVWHPYDVFEHTYRVVDGVENDLSLRLAALFHDIGKPETYNPEFRDAKEIGHFPKHWEKSDLIFNEFARNHDIDEATRDLVSRLILFHDVRFKYPISDEETFGELNKDLIECLTTMFNKEELKKLYNLRRADLAAQTKPDDYELDNDLEENTILESFGSKVK